MERTIQGDIGGGTVLRHATEFRQRRARMMCKLRRLRITRLHFSATNFIRGSSDEGGNSARYLRQRPPD